MDDWATIRAVAEQAGSALFVTAFLVWQAIRLLKRIMRSQRRIERKLEIDGDDEDGSDVDE
jgi:hypothetical protein